MPDQIAAGGNGKSENQNFFHMQIRLGAWRGALPPPIALCICNKVSVWAREPRSARSNVVRMGAHLIDKFGPE